MSTEAESSRRHERYSVLLDVTCRSSPDGIADQVVNLSAGGACIQTTHPLGPGTRHHFTMSVPDSKLRPNDVNVEATVAWTTDGAMGLRFDSLNGALDDYLRRLERTNHSI